MQNFFLEKIMKYYHRSGVFLVCLATPLWAQSTDDTSPRLEEVIVSGDKLARPLSETLSSVVVETGEDIAASTAASMKDIVTRYANLVSANGDREIAIRGVPQGGIGGEGETVSVVLDGVALPARAASFAGPLAAWDLGQVEILRGAQSTSQGRNSLAGAIILESQAPTPDWDLKLRAGAMSRDGHDYAIAVGGPISESLLFRVSAQDRYDNGDVKNLTRDEGDAGREIRRNQRIAFNWQPLFWSAYTADYRYSRSNNEFGDPLHDSSRGERTELSNVRALEDDVSDLHSLRQRLQLSDSLSLESVTGWSEFDSLYTVDFDRSEAEGGFSDNSNDEGIGSQEIQLRYRGSTLSGVIGWYYSDGERENRTDGYDVATAGGAVLLNGFIAGRREVKTDALFIDGDWDFAEGWRLSLGLRVNRERFVYAGQSDLDLTLNGDVPGVPAGTPTGVPLPDATSDALAALAPDFVPPDYDESDRGEYRDLLPKIALSWDVLDTLTLGISYKEGYRSGGTSISFFGGAVSPYEPEYTRTGELVARYQSPQRRVSVNSNLFYTDWRDQQVTIGETSGFETLTRNAGRSHYYGLETEVFWQATRHIELFTTVGLLHSEFDEFVNDGEDYTDNEYPFSPDYTVGVGARLRDWHGLDASLSANRIAPVFSDPDNDPRSRSDARTLVSARIAYTLGKGLSLAIYGRNLLDDLNEQGALVAGNRIASRYGEPRSVGMVAEWQWAP